MSQQPRELVRTLAGPRTHPVMFAAVVSRSSGTTIRFAGPLLRSFIGRLPSIGALSEVRDIDGEIGGWHRPLCPACVFVQCIYVWQIMS